MAKETFATTERKDHNLSLIHVTNSIVLLDILVTVTVMSFYGCICSNSEYFPFVRTIQVKLFQSPLRLFILDRFTEPDLDSSVFYKWR